MSPLSLSCSRFLCVNLHFAGFDIPGIAMFLYPENYTWFVCYFLAIILYTTLFFSCPSFWDVNSVLLWSSFPSWFTQYTYIAGSLTTASAPLDDQFLQPWCLGLGIFDSDGTDCTLWTFQMFQTLQVLSIAQSVCSCPTLWHLTVSLLFWRK